MHQLHIFTAMSNIKIKVFAFITFQKTLLHKILIFQCKVATEIFRKEKYRKTLWIK